MIDPIASYLGVLRRELSFDPELSHRVAGEIETHLLDIAEEEGNDIIARQHAVERMGAAKILAAGIAQETLPRHISSTWRTLALSAVAVFLAMRLRNSVLPVDATDTALALALAIDRFAFIAGIAIGSAGWWLSGQRKQPHRTQLGLALAVTSVAGLIAAGVAGVYVLTTNIASAGLAAPAAYSLLATTVEIAVLGAGAFGLFGLMRHVRLASASGIRATSAASP